MAVRQYARNRRIQPSRWGRALAVVLCVLALAVNLLGAVAYAQAWSGAAVSAGLDPNLSICHSQPDTATADTPAPETPKQPKCPLCTVAAAGLAAPPVQAPVALSLLAIANAVEVPAPDAPKLPLVATRPGSRAPPLSA